MATFERQSLKNSSTSGTVLTNSNTGPTLTVNYSGFFGSTSTSYSGTSTTLSDTSTTNLTRSFNSLNTTTKLLTPNQFFDNIEYIDYLKKKGIPSVITGDLSGNIEGGKLDQTVIGKITGIVLGDMNGTIEGDLNTTIVFDKISGSIKGKIFIKNLYGKDLEGEFKGTVSGTYIEPFSEMNGTFSGEIIGNLYGNISGSFSGSFLRITISELSGKVNYKMY